MEFQSGVPVSLPEPDSGVYPDDELGEALFTFGGLPEHLSAMLFKVPEGLVLRCLCDHGIRIPRTRPNMRAAGLYH